MDKGIIVMDIPQDCYGCSFATWYGKCMITGETVYHSPLGRRPDGCPIQPVPERIKGMAMSLYEYGRKEGYNKCIDNILGGNGDGKKETPDKKRRKTMKYRKNLVEVEAFVYDGDLMGSDGEYYVPGWAVRAFKTGVMHYKYGTEPQLYIKTLEGEHHVSIGDYIIRGIKGEIYPCKPDIFEMTYEPVQREELVQLKPCPFCGGEAVIRTIEPHTHHFVDMPGYPGGTFVECVNCTCAISADTEQEAKELWNRRA